MILSASILREFAPRSTRWPAKYEKRTQAVTRSGIDDSRPFYKKKLVWWSHPSQSDRSSARLGIPGGMISPQITDIPQNQGIYVIDTEGDEGAIWHKGSKIIGFLMMYRKLELECNIVYSPTSHYFMNSITVNVAPVGNFVDFFIFLVYSAAHLTQGPPRLCLPCLPYCYATAFIHDI